MWSHILLVLISFLCCVVVYRRLSSLLPHPEYLSYLILLLTAFMYGLSIVNVDGHTLSRYIELSGLTIVLLTLVLLLISVRLIQPEYARHPVIYSYFPVMVLPFYAYFVTTDTLEQITNIALQGTAILVYSGLVIAYWKSSERGYLLFISILLFGSGFGLYWFFASEHTIWLPVVHLLIGGGMIISSFKFPSILIKHQR